MAYFNKPLTSASAESDGARQAAPTTTNSNRFADFLATISEDLGQARAIARAADTTFNSQFLAHDAGEKISPATQESLEHMGSLIAMVLERIATAHDKLNSNFARIAQAGAPSNPFDDVSRSMPAPHREAAAAFVSARPREDGGPDAIDTYWAAFDAHNSGLIEADAYLAAFHGMHDFVPTTPRDFVRKFLAAYDMGGVPTQERRDQLLEQARALLAEAVGENGQSLRAAYLTAQRFEQFARGVSNRYREHIMAPVLQAHKDGLVDGEAVNAAEEGWEPHTSLHFDAIEALITTPAPDLAAVAEKIDLGRAEGAFTNGNRADQMLLCLSDDVRRIGGMPYSRAKSADAVQSAWEVAVAEWRAARQALEVCEDDDEGDRLCDIEVVAWRKMLDIPAPDNAALKFKLEQLLKVEACVDSTNGWEGREVRQTLADVARLLGDGQ